MSSPKRFLRSWLRHFRMRDVVGDVEWQLGIALKRSVRLVPARTGGGFDSIYIARGTRPPYPHVASVRLNCPWRDARPDESHLPRRSLSGPERIVREATVYRELAPHGLSPQLLVQGRSFLANEWQPWPRLSDLLRNDETLVWEVLPGVLRSVSAAHAHGVVHMDLNCGNVLLKPDGGACLIDFEYEAEDSLSKDQQQAFDVLRLVHNLLKPRRGRHAILQQPERFADMLQPLMPASASSLIETFASAWFDRIANSQSVALPLCRDGLAVDSVSGSAP
jgi:serine/threonine protein kinase